MTQLHKTALGAEQTVPTAHSDTIEQVITQLKTESYQIVAVEQSADSVKLPDFVPKQKIALLFGREVEGIEESVRQACDITVEIPMLGDKESYNVSVAAAIALYHCRFVA